MFAYHSIKYLTFQHFRVNQNNEIDIMILLITFLLEIGSIETGNSNGIYWEDLFHYQKKKITHKKK